MFDPALKGYWGSEDFEPALDTVLSIIERHTARSRASRSRCSTLPRRSSCARRLPDGVMMFTGDDFNYAELIAGDGERHSHALLGIFDAIAPVANAALAKLARATTPATTR